MKLKSYILLTAILIGTVLSSCENFLDRQPISDLSIDIYWKSEKDIKTWNAGMYYGMQTTLRENWFKWGEVRSCIYAPTGTSPDKSILYNGLTSLHATTSWSDLYATIYRANAGIKHIPETDLGPTIINPYLGQAHAMRALMYFYAIRVWGAVPKVTEPYEDNSVQEKFVGRTSVEEIVELILEDIEKAITYFGSETNMASADKYYLNRGSAMALKVDVLMWAHRYDEAKIAAESLINNYSYKLETNKDNYFNMFRRDADNKLSNSDTEIIFSMYWDYNEYGNGFGGAGLFSSGSNSIPYHPSEEYYRTLIARANEDVRSNIIMDTLRLSKTIRDKKGNPLYALTPETYAEEKPTIHCSKFVHADVTANNGFGGYFYPFNNQCQYHMPIYRLADIKLLYAEALAMTNDLQGAIAIVNEIRLRAGWTEEATIELYPTQKDVIKLIIDERTIELWAEGKHWFDLVRTRMVKEYLDSILQNLEGNDAIEEGFDIGASDPGTDHIGGWGRMLWPLNQDVFKKNPLMKGQQNNPYDE